MCLWTVKWNGGAKRRCRMKKEEVRVERSLFWYPRNMKPEDGWKRRFLFWELFFFRFHVIFQGCRWCRIISWNTLPTSSLPSKRVPLKNRTTSSYLCFLVIRFFNLNASSHINTTILTLGVGRKWHRITDMSHLSKLTSSTSRRI